MLPAVRKNPYSWLNLCWREDQLHQLFYCWTIRGTILLSKVALMGGALKLLVSIIRFCTWNSCLASLDPRRSSSQSFSSYIAYKVWILNHYSHTWGGVTRLMQLVTLISNLFTVFPDLACLKGNAHFLHTAYLCVARNDHLQRGFGAKVRSSDHQAHPPRFE